MIASLIWLLVVLAILAIVWWVVQQMGLPHPVNVVVVAIFAIVALVVIVKMLLAILGAPPGL